MQKRLMYIYKWIGIVVGLFVLTNSVTAQLTAEARLDSTQFIIGDQVQVHINIKQQSGTEVSDLDLSVLEAAEGFELVNVSAWDTISLTELRKDITIQVFDSGYYFVPSIPIRYVRNGRNNQLTTNELAFSVSTITANQEELAPIKPIEEEGRTIEDAIWIALIVLLFGLMVLGLLFFFSRGDQQEIVEPPVIQLYPHQIALKSLKTLEEKQLWQAGKVKTYHSELTKILRTYLEGRYGVQALEMTTREILQQLQTLEFDLSWKDRLTSMLQSVDLVKFAKAEPTENFHIQSAEDVKAFVLATKEEVEEIEEAIEEKMNIEAEVGFVLSDFSARASALFVDVLILVLSILFVNLGIAFILVFTKGYSAFFQIVAENAWIFLLFNSVLLLLLTYYYLAFLIYKKGGSPGKRILNIKIVNDESESLSLAKSTLRWLAGILSFLLAFIGYLLPLFRKDNKTLHDLIAGTYAADVIDKTPTADAKLAGFEKRLGAFLIDSLVFSLIGFLLKFLISSLFVDSFQSMLIFSLSCISFYWIYAALYLKNTAATIGMKVMKIYVANRDGSPISLRTATIRAIFYLIGIGHLLYFFSKHRQGLHDNIAQVYVYETE